MIVIGAGVAGLTFARDLARAGHEVTVIDAGDVAGGVVRQRPLGDLVIDCGAESFAIARPEARDLLDELGLSSLVETPARSDAQLALATGLFPLPPGLLGIPVDLDDPRVEAIIGPEGVAKAKALDIPRSTVPGTMGEVVREHMGAAVAELLVDPVLSGVHACSVDRAELDSVNPRLRPLLEQGRTLQQAALELRGGLGSAGAAVASLRGGMSILIDALSAEASGLGVEVRQSTHVRAVTATTSGGWVVTTDSGAMETDNVCLAVPAPSAARLLVGLGHLGKALDQVCVTDVAVVALLVQCEALDSAPVGSGVLVSPRRSDVQAKAMTHATAKWAWLAERAGAGRHVLRLSYGRAGEPVAMSDDQLIDTAVRDAAALTGAPIDAAAVEAGWVQHWRGSLVDPRRGHAAVMASIRQHAREHPGLSLIGSALGGNGIAGVVADARGTAASVRAHSRGA